jgi:hypothetical protein
MAYHQFTIERVRREFHLTVVDEVDLFAKVEPVEVGEPLSRLLEEYLPLAIGIATEKAKSELIVAPILLETRRRMGGAIGFFSGIEFNVDESRGLNGVCDFLLSKSRLQILLAAPVLAVVEAKNDNMKSGLGQCASEMIAAQIFNEREGEGPSTIFGVVTNGTAWRFLRLEGTNLGVDRQEYPIEQPGKILGNLLHCVGGPI